MSDEAKASLYIRGTNWFLPKQRHYEGTGSPARRVTFCIVFAACFFLVHGIVSLCVLQQPVRAFSELLRAAMMCATALCLRNSLLDVRGATNCCWLTVAISLAFFYVASTSDLELFVTGIHFTPSYAPFLLAEVSSLHSHFALGLLQFVLLRVWFWWWLSGVTDALVIRSAMRSFYAMLVHLGFVTILNWWLDKSRLDSLKELNMAKEHAEQLSRFKTHMIGSLSHEIRSPLQSVICCAEMLQQSCLDGLQREQVQTIVDSARTQMEMVEHLLKYASSELTALSESGETPLNDNMTFSLNPSMEPTEFQLKMLHRDVRSVILPVCSKKGLHLHFSCAPGMIRAAYVPLKMVMLNLLSNSVKYTDNGWVSCDVHVEGSTLFCSVADTGVGISESNLDKVWEPFFRERPSQGSGVGLGLTLARRFISLMGGEIRVRRRDEGGTVFDFRIPVSVSHDAFDRSCSDTDSSSSSEALAENVFRLPPSNHSGHVNSSMNIKSREAVARVVEVDYGRPPPMKAPSVFEREGREVREVRILVVDDSDVNRKVLANIVRRVLSNAVIFEADCGYSALDLLNQGRRFDVVCCDWIMPGMSGLELAAAWRVREKLNGWPRTPFIGISGAATTVEAQDLMRDAGMDQVMEKPIVVAKFRDTLLSLLRL